MVRCRNHSNQRYDGAATVRQPIAHAVESHLRHLDNVCRRFANVTGTSARSRFREYTSRIAVPQCVVDMHGGHCVMTKAISHTALVLTLAVMSIGAARADDVPDLNVDPVCRGIAQQASGPGERGGPDLAFSQCVKSEQAMRQKLMGEWSTFAPADRANCVGSERGALASYTDLVTCLEMARDARQLNK